jgi:hypothetical protein
MHCVNAILVSFFRAQLTPLLGRCSSDSMKSQMRANQYAGILRPFLVTDNTHSYNVTMSVDIDIHSQNIGPG